MNDVKVLVARCGSRRASGKPCSVDARSYCPTCNAIRCGIHAPLNRCNYCTGKIESLTRFASVNDLMATLYPRLRGRRYE